MSSTRGPRVLSPLEVESLRAYPDEDGPRQQIARRYRAEDDPRGEFIEAQLALTRRSPPSGAARSALEARARELLELFAESWLDELGLVAGDATFARGLVDEITLPVERLVSLHDMLFERACPRSLRLRLDKTKARSLAEALALPGLRTLRSLRLDGQRLRDDDARAIASSESLHALAALDLSRNRIGDKGVGWLADAPGLLALRSLDLSANRVGPKGARLLAQHRGLPSLVELDLSWNLLGDEGANALARGSGLGALTSLRVRANEIGDQAAQALVTSASLPLLASLDLASNRVFRVALLREWAQARKLRGLDLSENEPFRRRRPLRP